MTTLNKERIVTTLINTAITIIAMFIILGLQNKKTNTTALNEKIRKLDEEKAKIEYVDKMDNSLRVELNKRFDTQEENFRIQYNTIIEMLKEQGNYIRALKK